MDLLDIQIAELRKKLREEKKYKPHPRVLLTPDQIKENRRKYKIEYEKIPYVKENHRKSAKKYRQSPRGIEKRKQRDKLKLKNPFKNFREYQKIYYKPYYDSILREYAKNHYRKTHGVPKFQTPQQYRERKNLERKRWKKRYPEKVLAQKKRSLKRKADMLNITSIEFKHALLYWSKTIRKNTPFCSCGKLAVHVHHLFYQGFYPGLALNLGNGIALCLQCHNEVHGNKLTKYL